jgi:hypothetical protein
MHVFSSISTRVIYKVKLKYLTLVNSQTDTTCAIIISCALGLRFLS